MINSTSVSGGGARSVKRNCRAASWSSLTISLKILICLVFRFRLGDALNFNYVPLAQPGYHLPEMISRPATGLVHK
jgi:hypothetical protein